MLHLEEDADRFIICAALWLRFNRTGHPELTANEIRWLDLIFDRNAEISFEINRVNTGAQIGAINPSGERELSKSVHWARGSNPASAGGEKFWRSRLDALRRKMNKKYWPLIDPKRKLKQSDVLTRDELEAAKWLVASFMAIDAVFHGRPESSAFASAAFSLLRWDDLPEVARQRFSSILRWSSQQIDITG